ncbi:MAG: 30S ribosome-binding factor RbfA [Acidimicrobiia bacterium]
MREASPRMLKVNSTLREVLAEEVERMSDDRLEMVSITAVDTSPNLRSAVVYVDVLGADAQEAALIALGKASLRLQKAIGRQVRMKYTPTLEFEIDPGVLGGNRIETILRSLREEESEDE